MSSTDRTDGRTATTDRDAIRDWADEQGYVPVAGVEEDGPLRVEPDPGLTDRLRSVVVWGRDDEDDRIVVDPEVANVGDGAARTTIRRRSDRRVRIVDVRRPDARADAARHRTAERPHRLHAPSRHPTTETPNESGTRSDEKRRDRLRRPDRSE